METFKTCLECGLHLVGREDKKFCGDGCRTVFNNRRKKKDHVLMRHVNGRLKRNHRILSGLNPEGKTQVSRSILLGKGFDFGYFTHMQTTQKGKTYFFLYDQGYRFLADESCRLIRNDP